MEKTPDLRLGVMTTIFGVLAVVFVVALAIAPAKTVYTEWRDVQEEYNLAAAAVGEEPIEPAIQQIWVKELSVVDRCTSCHVGMGPGEPVPGHELFGSHPEIPHEPARIGCTLCHAGQGRATTKKAAHGEVEHWFEPLLDREHFEAGCGSCHSRIPVGRIALADRGKALFERYDCLACHEVNGRGGGRAAPATMPDLSGVGLRGVPADWDERHLELRAKDPDGLIAESYGTIELDDVAAISEYLGTLVGMPRLARGKRLFHEKGCRGCHVVSGVGGTDGPDLSAAGLAIEEELVFPANFRGERTLGSWHVEHLLAPTEVVDGSLMPDQGLSREEAEDITLYLLSLRLADIPGEYWPPDRLRAERLGEREFGTDGDTLFRVFCAACHGAEGQGSAHGGLFLEAVPGVVNRDLLAVASDEFLRRVLEKGRPSRRMPAWIGSESGLRPDEVRRLVAWIRSNEPAPPGYFEVAAASADPALGAKTYETDCAVCHGEKGEGLIGPSHRTPAFMNIASDRFLYDTLTEGRPGTAMPRFREFDAATLKSLILHLRALADERLVPVDTLRVSLPEANPERGGRVFGATCAACHGTEGEGGLGPAIGKREFLVAAGRGFVVESYSRGRCRDEQKRPAPSLPRQDLADAAAWLEWRSERAGPELGGRRVKGDRERGGRIFKKVCAGCHGAAGEGKEGPALANEEFLAAANDGYLQATIVRGRRGSAMPSFDVDQPKYPRITAGEIDDIVSFIRSLAGGEKENQ